MEDLIIFQGHAMELAQNAFVLVNGGEARATIRKLINHS